MLQNPCKALGFKKNMVYKIPPGGGGVNHIQPVAYMDRTQYAVNMPKFIRNYRLLFKTFYLDK